VCFNFLSIWKVVVSGSCHGGLDTNHNIMFHGELLVRSQYYGQYCERFYAISAVTNSTGKRFITHQPGPSEPTPRTKKTWKSDALWTDINTSMATLVCAPDEASLLVLLALCSLSVGPLLPAPRQLCQNDALIFDARSRGSARFPLNFRRSPLVLYHHSP